MEQTQLIETVNSSLTYFSYDIYQETPIFEESH